MQFCQEVPHVPDHDTQPDGHALSDQGGPGSEQNEPCVTEAFKQAVSKQQHAWVTGDMAEYGRWRNNTNRLTCILNLRKSFYWRTMAQVEDSDPKSWWGTIQSLTGSREGLHPCFPLANSQCDGDTEELAFNINQFFQSVAAHLPPLNQKSPFLNTPTKVPERYIISVDDVEKQLTRLNTCKATGPDYIFAWVLRDFAHHLAGPLCAAFNNSIREGFVPDLWKTDRVIPLPKKSPLTRIESDLRPVSLTQIVSNVLEHFMCKWVSDAVAPNIHQRLHYTCSG